MGDVRTSQDLPQHYSEIERRELARLGISARPCPCGRSAVIKREPGRVVTYCGGCHRYTELGVLEGG